MLSLTIGKADHGMDWLQWTSSIVGSVAWPIAVVVVAYLFRIQLNSLLQRLSEFSLGDASVKFTKALDRIENETLAEPDRAAFGGASTPESIGDKPQDLIESAAVPEEQRSDAAWQSGPPSSSWIQMLAISPNLAVLESWREIEAELDELLAAASVSIPPGVSIISRATRLFQSGALDINSMRLLVEMQELRSSAARNDPVSEADAARFKILCDKLVQDFGVARRRIKSG